MTVDRPRVGPKAAEDEVAVLQDGAQSSRGLSLRAVLPNAITAAALCSGLTGIRFAITEDWGPAIIAVILAGLLDGIDGRVARLLKAQSRFGAEMDSLADSLSFGMAPALILYLWSLQELPRIGWFASLAFAICCALRLARFNAQIDADEQPHKSAGFLTGVPAPVAAGLAFLPFYIWMETGQEWLRNPIAVGIWLAVIAVLMVSNVATLTWASLRPRRNVRLGVIGAVGVLFAGLLLEPWWALTAICLVYLALMPLGIIRYGRVRQRRRQQADAAHDPDDSRRAATLP
ncbi:CDP-diacylglycerol--serine O-phosphatidyltransferase [Alteripontixanthobacter maritimus]|uniref:CDP-diacylglycerol--serine O-phosphatidyltransferase n=1 Tax=Alteripontixanthobacter maritimus TaxID=2161824 RepID=A0A369QAU5_9SPHN|nr:phosphatidylcholine/phosphatidylserine synthase [Alteripontixanthobacter maritimus]RDC60346.1 CDP-diacylglycerol--serine O-phosphatidyltransferase [Alteripontixanthobacter maritimus]